MDSIRFGWATFKKRAWFFVGVTAILLVTSWLIGEFSELFGDRDLGGLAGALVSIGLSSLLSLGFTALFIRAHDSLESADVKDMWHPQAYWRFLAAELLTGIAVFLGFILLIIPGIIAILAFLFTQYLVIDKGLGPIAAMKESARITKGVRWELLLFVFIALAINILGFIALFVGLLVSIPVTMLSLVHAYRTLQTKAGGAGA